MRQLVQELKIFQLRPKLLGEKSGRPPKNSTQNAASNNGRASLVATITQLTITGLK
jgi:hypothetical protein